MPFFDFSGRQGQPMVFTRFWIYWAITIPLTVTVMLLWLVTRTQPEDKTRDRYGEAQNPLTRDLSWLRRLMVLKRWIQPTEPFDVEKAR